MNILAILILESKCSMSEKTPERIKIHKNLYRKSLLQSFLQKSHTVILRTPRMTSEECAGVCKMTIRDCIRNSRVMTSGIIGLYQWIFIYLFKLPLVPLLSVFFSISIFLPKMVNMYLDWSHRHTSLRDSRTNKNKSISRTASVTCFKSIKLGPLYTKDV